MPWPKPWARTASACARRIDRRAPRRGYAGCPPCGRPDRCGRNNPMPYAPVDAHMWSARPRSVCSASTTGGPGPHQEKYQCRDWQTAKPLNNGLLIGSFTLLLTVRPDKHTARHPGVDDLVQLVDENMTGSDEFREQWEARFGGVSPSDLADNNHLEFFLVAIPKCMVEAGSQAGWDVESQKRFVYNRYPEGLAPYTMISDALTFTRRPGPSHTRIFNPRIGNPIQAAFDLSRARIQQAAWRPVIYVEEELADPEVKSRVLADLAAVKEYRDNKLAELYKDQSSAARCPYPLKSSSDISLEGTRR